jgi:predicted HTH transcriptional regulator
LVSTPEAGSAAATSNDPSRSTTVRLPASQPKPEFRRLTEAEVLGLIEHGETQDVEFKATFRADERSGQDNPHMARMAVRAIASFMNTRGGTLLLGVTDDKSIPGVDADIRNFSRENRDGHDVFQQSLANEIRKGLGAAAAGQVDIRLVAVGARTVCVVQVPRSAVPVYAAAANDQQEFFIRAGTTSQSLNHSQTNAYIKSNWG